MWSVHRPAIARHLAGQGQTKTHSVPAHFVCLSVAVAPDEPTDEGPPDAAAVDDDTAMLMPPRSKAQGCLRACSVVLVLLYVHNFLRIAELETTAGGRGAGGGEVAGPDAAARIATRAPSHASRANDCAAALIFRCYLAACLLWSAAIVAAKRGADRRRCVFLDAALLLLALRLFRAGGCGRRTVDGIEATPADWRSGRLVATGGDGRAWGGRAIRISLRLHAPGAADGDGRLLPPDAFSKRNYRCADRPPLPPSLADMSVLNFTASVRTDLRIAFMGDSIGAQFAQAFDAAALGGNGGRDRRWAQGYRYNPALDWVSECLSVAAPLEGGGVSALWRMTGLMSADNRKSGRYLCDRDHHNDKGWGEDQALTLIDHRVNYNGTDQGSVGAYDAFVMRVPHGWMSLEQITREGIVEQIELANRYLGFSTVIISTLPLCNNAVTPSDWAKLGQINGIIRDIAHNWQPPHPEERGVRTVLVQEFGNFTSQVIWSNARDIGYDIPAPDPSRPGWENEGADFLFDRLAIQGKWPPSKPQVCANRRQWYTDNKGGGKNEQCDLNRISVDGSHWCVSSIGPRHSASVACLLGCVYNGRTDGGEMEGVRECERSCNDQFMSIVPVDRRWIGTGMNIFSLQN